MDIWKPFYNATTAAAPQAPILFDKLLSDSDKFHAMRHPGEALDEVRKAEYAHLGGKDRRFIKGQKYARLARREKLGRRGAALPQAAARCQQAAQHRLPPQRELWSAPTLRRQ